MKKISLKNLDALGIRKLSRESLKNVTGGLFCPPGEFQCRNGACVPASALMDGIWDCQDGSDEEEGTYSGGECIGTAGEWFYKVKVNADQCQASINEYCSTGQGICH
ncbi:hypothetical protein HF324_27500 [Chitinophaga oryzae]|uniref:Uncharacterized protein n=1 Tax=Chitinophaga oryzae TaxID=2725414 RepID=A0AAE6ZMW5_9BACT|nr:low-density lipoprotein receptor class A repeat-containing protein [Chitinophaga oryzae]QJB34873.1 hypothetical protein HF329_27640 [Chitinophaga oryzae]QJB41385.1 hypothetical protein HF324_27500 [Chitinophaga oryzae]